MNKSVLSGRVLQNHSAVPELQFYELNQRARQLGDRQDWPGAIQAWTELAEASRDSAPSLYKTAKQELDALKGEGGFGRRFEILSRRFFGHAMNPAALAGMAIGSGVFSLSRGILLDQLFLSQAGILTRAWGARAMSGIVASALEAVACAMTNRLFSSPIGNSTHHSFPSGFAASYLSLGGMRLAGSAGQTVAGKVGNRLVRETISKGSAYLGILSGEAVERQIGLRPDAGIENALFDGATTWLQAHVGARLLGVALGPHWSAWQGEVSDRGEQGLRSPKLSVKARSPALGHAGSGMMAAVSGAVLCVGCEKGATDQWPLVLGLGALTGLGLRQYRRMVLMEGAADTFHALPRKSWDDFHEAAMRSTGLSAQEVSTVLGTVLHYGAPPEGERLTNAAPFKKIAVNLLRLPPVQRRGGFSSLHHQVPYPTAVRESYSTIYGMPLAYADRMRAWARAHLDFPESMMATPHQMTSRVEILAKKIASEFNLPVGTSLRLVELVLRPSGEKLGEQKGQLFSGPMQDDLFLSNANYEYHLKLNRAPAELILRESGLGHRSVPWLKQIIVSLAAECRIPVPGYSMNPSMEFNIERNYDLFTDHDWHAVFRLRDAVWGPWRLPWEELPNESGQR